MSKKISIPGNMDAIVDNTMTKQEIIDKVSLALQKKEEVINYLKEKLANQEAPPEKKVDLTWEVMRSRPTVKQAKTGMSECNVGFILKVNGHPVLTMTDFRVKTKKNGRVTILSPSVRLGKRDFYFAGFSRDEYGRHVKKSIIDKSFLLLDHDQVPDKYPVAFNKPEPRVPDKETTEEIPNL